MITALFGCAGGISLSRRTTANSRTDIDGAIQLLKTKPAGLIVLELDLSAVRYEVLLEVSLMLRCAVDSQHWKVRLSL